MNDFLQSLRGGQKDKRTPKTRRSFDNANFNAVPNYQNHGNYQGTRAGNIKRPTTRGTTHAHNMPGGEHQPSFAPPLDPLDLMLDLLDVYTKNQEMLITVQEKRVIAEERKAIALEEIAEYLRVATISLNESFSFKRPSPSEAAIDEDSDILESEPLEAEEVDSEVVYDEYDDPQDIAAGDVDFQNSDAQYVDSQIIDSEEEDTQEIQYTSKPSVQDSSQEDSEKSIKVIRRKKMETKSVVSPRRAEKLEIPSQSKSEPIKIVPENRNSLPETEETKKTATRVDSQVTREALLPREEVMEIIQSMRSQGKTFDEVAQHLVALGQPTFSGRGDWHAQTIHRLCTKKSKKEQKEK